VHRDIKPENVFVQTNGELKVLDFGIARILDESPRDAAATNTGRMLGTPAFMPPEQAYGRRAEVDAQSDLWSAGATLFTAVAGRVVHLSDTAEETLIKAATEPAPSLASVVEGVPEPVAAFLDKALAAEKADRWASAAAMLDALDAAYRDVFGTPVPQAIEVELPRAAVAPVTIARPRLPATKRMLRTIAWALPLAGIVALVVSGRAAPSVPAPARVTVAGEPAIVTKVEAPAAAPIASEPARPEAPAVARVEPPRPAAARPPSSPARSAAPALAIAVAIPAAATSGAAAPVRVCGYEIDEEGRKWPKRCP
jgi:serine/threonine-protein kinase